MRKHSYRATDVERLDVDALARGTVVGCIVAIDVAKTNFLELLVHFIEKHVEEGFEVHVHHPAAAFRAARRRVRASPDSGL